MNTYLRILIEDFFLGDIKVSIILPGFTFTNGKYYSLKTLLETNNLVVKRKDKSQKQPIAWVFLKPTVCEYFSVIAILLGLLKP